MGLRAPRYDPTGRVMGYGFKGSRRRPKERDYGGRAGFKFRKFTDMKHSKKSITVKIVLVPALGVIVYLGGSLRNTQFLNRDPLASRPSGKNASIFDYAGILEDVAPSTENYLSIIDELDAQLLSGGAGAKRQLTELS